MNVTVDVIDRLHSVVEEVEEKRETDDRCAERGVRELVYLAWFEAALEPDVIGARLDAILERFRKTPPTARESAVPERFDSLQASALSGSCLAQASVRGDARELRVEGSACASQSAEADRSRCVQF